MTATTTPVTVPAMVTLGGCPTEDCHHPGLPHISDCTGPGPWCHAEDTNENRCTLPGPHDGPHVAGNGEYIVALWGPNPTRDWRRWHPVGSTATRALPVLSWAHAEGAGGGITSGGFVWYPPHERDLVPAAALAAYQREVADTDVPARVRLLLLPVPAQVGQWATVQDPASRDLVTRWIESRTDEVEVTAPAVHETIYTPGDPEPEVRATVQKQYLNARGYDVDAAEPETHIANRALRDLPRGTVAALRDNDDSSDELALNSGWLGGHEGGFYVAFDGAPDPSDGLPGPLAEWLAWTARWRHLLGSP